VQVLQTWRQSKNVWQRFCNRFLKRPFLTVSRSFMNVANSVLWRMAIILKANKVNLFVSSVLFFFLVPFTECFRHTTYMQIWLICSVNSLHYITEVNEGWTGIKLYIPLGRSKPVSTPKLLSFRAITSFYVFQMSF
jgi:hypothetical protein